MPSACRRFSPPPASPRGGRRKRSSRRAASPSTARPSRARVARPTRTPTTSASTAAASTVQGAAATSSSTSRAATSRADPIPSAVRPSSICSPRGRPRLHLSGRPSRLRFGGTAAAHERRRSGGAPHASAPRRGARVPSAGSRRARRARARPPRARRHDRWPPDRAGRRAPRARATSPTGPQAILSLVIHEGRNRQVRKMCEAIGHPVVQLKRVRIGPITDDRLSSGEFRDLTPAEIDRAQDGARPGRSSRSTGRETRSARQDVRPEPTSAHMSATPAARSTSACVMSGVSEHCTCDAALARASARAARLDRGNHVVVRCRAAG